jgi:hypothetical protein
MQTYDSPEKAPILICCLSDTALYGLHACKAQPLFEFLVGMEKGEWIGTGIPKYWFPLPLCFPRLLPSFLPPASFISLCLLVHSIEGSTRETLYLLQAPRWYRGLDGKQQHIICAILPSVGFRSEVAKGEVFACSLLVGEQAVLGLKAL